MYYPTFVEIQQLRDAAMASSADKRKKPLLPLYRDILTDLETPVSANCKTAQGPYSFLLESVTGGERVARFSLIGINPYLVITHQGKTATLYKMGPNNKVEEERRDPTLIGDDKLGSHNGTIISSIEEIPCHDPLQLIENELGQYRLVMPVGVSQDELQIGR